MSAKFCQNQLNTSLSLHNLLTFLPMREVFTRGAKPPFHGGNTGSNPVRVADYRTCFILSNLHRSHLGDFIILLTVSLRYPLKSTVSKPTSEFWF